MTAWLIYAVAVGALVAGAAAAADSWASGRGLARRWAWVAGLVLALGLPAAVALRPVVPAWGAPAAAAAARGDGASGGSLAARLREAVARMSRAAGQADPAVAPLWALMSGAGLLWLLGGALRLRGQRGTWRGVEMDGVRALLSPDTGPAVVGLARPAIVVPAWVLELDPATRRLLLAHEAEHVRAGDHRLLGLALLAVVAMPWNPAVWWIHARLRVAVELDCDARVLRHHPQPVHYGGALLEVGRRRSRTPLPAATFAAPPGALEQRLRAILLERRRDRLPGAVLAVAVAALAGAWVLPPPPRPSASIITVREMPGGGTLSRAAPSDTIAASWRHTLDAGSGPDSAVMGAMARFRYRQTADTSASPAGGTAILREVDPGTRQR